MLRKMVLAVVAAIAVGTMTFVPTVASARGGRGGGGRGGGFRSAGIRSGGGIRGGGFRRGGFRAARFGRGIRRGFRGWGGPVFYGAPVVYGGCWRWWPTRWGYRLINVCYDW